MSNKARPVRRSDGVEYASQNEAARDTGIPLGWIRNTCIGLRKCACGYGFEYIDGPADNAAPEP